MKNLLIVCACLLFAGCLTHKPNMTDIFPKGLEAVCAQQLAAAKAGIERCGTPLKKQRGVEVYLHKGEQKINGMWCWQIGPNYYVGGLTEWGYRIQVGSNPVTGGEVSTGVLFHEFGHYWLITNKGINGHDPKYDPVFHWSGLGPMGRRTNLSTKDRVVDGPHELPRGDLK